MQKVQVEHKKYRLNIKIQIERKKYGLNVKNYRLWLQIKNLTERNDFSLIAFRIQEKASESSFAFSYLLL